MKRIIPVVMSAALILSFSLMYTTVLAADETVPITYNYNLVGEMYKSDDNQTRQMEKIDRGLVAIKSGSTVFLSWRLFDSEDNIYGSAGSDVKFNVYRDGEKVNDEPLDKTNYTDETIGTAYQVAPVVDGIEGEKCAEASVSSTSYIEIPLQRPEQETITAPNGETVGTFPFGVADCSTGDLDGDGEYEIIIKWTSSEHDVGSPGDGIQSLSGTVRFAAYKLNGKKLWENDINLGKNVYSSAHTVQFLVYDFNGDGKAEMMCQTSLGSKDASDAYVSHSAKTDEEIAAYTDEDNENAEFRGTWGPITKGDEFLTVFEGETGKAIDTINFPTARVGDGSSFGDTSGNRSNRFVASVAYLDGEKPYAVYLRGYYFGRNGNQRTGISGTSFDGEKLSVDYQFDTLKNQPGYYDGAGIYVGNGNHNCTVADVDNDGKDEFITGALCMEVNDDNEFRPRWCTFMEHGDALHIGDYDPTIPGLEFFTIHEDGGPNTMSGTEVPIDFGMTVINSNTGEIIKHWTSGGDNGRGIMANIGAGGFYQVKSANAGCYQSNGGSNFTAGDFGMSQNFRVFWDGDLFDELLDGTGVTDWNGRGMSSIFDASRSGCTKVNGTKSTPSLQADILGDWREELIYPTTGMDKLRVFITTTPTDYKIKTLMHDPVYRSGVAAEQTAYNQPPHVGFYMSESMFRTDITSLTITHGPNRERYVKNEQFDSDGLIVTANYADGEPEEVKGYILSGFDSETVGDKTITVEYKGKTATFVVKVLDVNKIELTSPPTKTEYIQGERLDLTGMVVTATYSDGLSAVVDNDLCETSGFITSKVGEQTVTVSYAGQSAEFKVNVKEATLSDVNGTYENSKTNVATTSRSIGSFTGAYVFEHTFKINSMPAAGNINNKSTISGFTLRFMSDDTETVKGGTGSGWTLVPSSNRTTADVYWKSSENQAAKISQTQLKLGETYTVRYAFTDVATGAGARVSMYVYDSSNKAVVTAKNLELRNFTFDAQKAAPINRIDITTQAVAENTPASVTIDGTKVKLCGVVGVNGRKISFNLNNADEVENVHLIAAKYRDSALTNLKILNAKVTAPGMSEVATTFDPDKIYVWDGMAPLEVWSRE